MAEGVPGVAEDLQHAVLESAKKGKWKECLQQIQEHPEIINTMIAGRWSVLHQAAHHAPPEVVKQLLDLKANPNMLEGRQSRRPSQVARVAKVKELLEHAETKTKRVKESAAGRFGGDIMQGNSTLHKSNYLHEYTAIKRDGWTHEEIAESLRGVPAGDGAGNQLAQDVRHFYLRCAGSEAPPKAAEPARRAAWMWTTDWYYEGINRDALIPDTQEAIHKYAPTMRVLNQYIQANGPTEDVTTYRGSQADPEIYKLDKWYRFGMYVASSTNPETGARFAKKSILIFEIEEGCLNAGSLKDVSAFPEETEYLLPPYTAAKCVEKGEKEWTYFSQETFVEEKRTLPFIRFQVAFDNKAVEQEFEAEANKYVNTNYYKLMRANEYNDKPTPEEVMACLEQAGAKLPEVLKTDIERKTADKLDVSEEVHMALMLATLEREDCEDQPPYLVLGELMEKDTEEGVMQVLPFLRTLDAFFALDPVDIKHEAVWVERRNLKADFLDMCAVQDERFIFNHTMFLVVQTEEQALQYRREGSTLFSLKVPDGPCPWLRSVGLYCLRAKRFQLALRPYTIVKSKGKMELVRAPEVPAYELELLSSDHPDGDVLDGIKVATG